MDPLEIAGEPPSAWIAEIRYTWIKDRQDSRIVNDHLQLMTEKSLKPDK